MRIPTNAYIDTKINKIDIDINNANSVMTYGLLRCLTEQEQEQIKQKISSKKATDTEKLEYQKYWFNKIIKPTQEQLDDIMGFYSDVFHNYYLVEHKKEMFMNVFYENKANVEHQLVADYNNSGGSIEINQMRAAKLNYILELNRRLGLTNSYREHKKVERDKIEAMTDYLQKENENIHLVFGIKNQSKKEIMEYEQSAKLIKKIYNTWSGCGLKECIKNKSTKKVLVYETYNKFDAWVYLFSLIK